MTANAASTSTSSRADATCFILVLIYFLGSVPTLEQYLGNPDHGYQLALGRQVTLGAFPFIDLFSHYGPLVAFTSAAMFTVHDSIVPETILCALMYAVSVTLLFHMVRVYSAIHGRAAIGVAALAAALSLLLMGRLYKWYFWFFPLLVLALLCEAFLHKRTSCARNLRLLCAGLIAGSAALYRLDLGVACWATAISASIVFAIDRRAWRNAWLAVLVLSIGFFVPLAVWHAALFAAGGHAQDYWIATFSGASGVVSARGLPLPMFDFSNPFSVASSLFVALMGASIAYVVAIGAGLRQGLRTGSTPSRPVGFLTLNALMGLAILPQALHRPDVGHFVTVIPPLLALAFSGCAFLWTASKNHRPFRAAVVVLALAAIGVAAGIEKAVHRDTEAFGRNLGDRYRLLSLGPEAYLKTMQSPERRREVRAVQQAHLLRIVHKLTAPQDTVLPYGIIPSCFYIDRRFSGLFPRYVNGIFDSAYWIERDRERMGNNPPALILEPIETGLFNPGASMHNEYIAEHYTRGSRSLEPELPYRIYVH